MENFQCSELNYLVPEKIEINLILNDQAALIKFCESFFDTFIFVFGLEKVKDTHSKKSFITLLKKAIKNNLFNTQKEFYFTLLKYMVLNLNKEYKFETLLDQLSGDDCMKDFSLYFEFSMEDFKEIFTLKKSIETNTVYFSKEMQKLISEVKSELPLILSNAFDLYAGNIIRHDGVSMTVKEYSKYTGISTDILKRQIANAKSLVQEKLKRKGVSDVVGF